MDNDGKADYHLTFTVVGVGYVGASSAALLAKRYPVRVTDISSEKLKAIQENTSPVTDEELERLLSGGTLQLTVAEDVSASFRASDYILVATPTDYDTRIRHLNTDSIESVIRQIHESQSRATIVIKSTIPDGFLTNMQRQYPERVFLYAPEFLRENRAMYDQLHPSRIVIGCNIGDEKAEQAADTYIEALLSCVSDKDIPVLIMTSEEATAVKLFSNEYLAMRVAFFNELDTYAESKNFDSKRIIEGVCAEPRIGNYYNNPSFGYGGYCLPKDTRQLLSAYTGIPQKLIQATIEANEARMAYIVDHIMKSLPARFQGTVGIYRLIMKTGSDNYRDSSVLHVMEGLRDRGVSVTVYEPALGEASFFEGVEVVWDLDTFKQNSDLIVTNRIDQALEDVMDKVYTRDLYHKD